MSNEEIIGDLMGAGTLANPELVNKVYDDVVAGPAKELGTALTHVAKSCRLLFAPFQLAASCTERLDKWYAEITSKVPQERQQEAPPHIAGPVLENLVFMEDENPIGRLYLELLTRAIDKERQHEAHPAFNSVIEQLSPDEAMVLYLLSTSISTASLRARRSEVTRHNLPADRLAFPEHLLMYCSHLEALNLLTRYDLEEDPKRDTLILTSDEPRPERDFVFHLTGFGRLFAKACIPEDFSLESTLEEVQNQGSMLAGQHVRVTVVDRSAQQANGSGKANGDLAPNAAMLQALSQIEEIRKGMNPKKDKKDYLREARSGAMYGIGDDD